MKFREALGLVLLKLPLIGDAIVTTTMKILIDAAFNQGRNDMKPKVKIPFFIRKFQCNRCLLKQHVACSVWGGVAPPLWTVYFFGLRWCGSFIKGDKTK